MWKKLSLVLFALALGAPGCAQLYPSGGDGGGGGGGGGGSGDWQQLTLLEDAGGVDHSSDDVLAINCSDADHCIVATQHFGQSGGLFEASGSEVTDVLISGDEAASKAGHADSVIAFTGFDRAGGKLVARMDKSFGFLSASGDGNSADQWSVAPIGDDLVGLNSQVMFAESGGYWIYFRQGVVWGSDTGPGNNPVWTGLWSPGRVPPFPDNYDDLKNADDTICNSDPTVSGTVQQAQFAHASADLGVIIYPAAGLNQGGASANNYDAPGVCVSVDRGQTFHQVPFPAADIVDSDSGPRAINCTDDDHCWAYKAYQFGEDNPYLFYTTNATSGLSMTWTRGALPNIDLAGVTFRQVFFAPDNQHGWLVGDFDSRKPLLFATSDGGATWDDLSAKVQATMGDGELWTGAAADADHIWIGGEQGNLLAGSTGGR